MLCIKSERYIGTDSGGMDQAIAMLAEEGSAKLIDFIPQLNATNVKLPEGVCWYVAHCGVSMHKAITSHYNIRVAETRLAAAFIAKKLKIAGYKFGDQLWVVQQASAIPVAEMGDCLAKIFDTEKKFYTKMELINFLGNVSLRSTSFIYSTLLTIFIYFSNKELMRMILIKFFYHVLRNLLENFDYINELNTSIMRRGECKSFVGSVRQQKISSVLDS